MYDEFPDDLLDMKKSISVTRGRCNRGLSDGNCTPDVLDGDPAYLVYKQCHATQRRIFFKPCQSGDGQLNL